MIGSTRNLDMNATLAAGQKQARLVDRWNLPVAQAAPGGCSIEQQGRIS